MDYYRAVKDKETEFGDLTKRMDDDKDLLYLKKYKMKDKDGREIPGIINITLNDPAIFAANVISGLGATSQQIVVETENKKLDTAYIEEFQKASLSFANTRLTKSGRALLNPFFDEQLCIRGRAAARCLFRMENGELVPDIIPVDTRYFTYEIGVEGMIWGGYKTFRSKALIKSEYGIDVAGKIAEVVDIWDCDQNEVWIQGRKAFSQENPYGYPPFVLQVVSLGSMLQDKDTLCHQGESIFFLIRDIIPELNRLVSILQTLNLAAVKGAKQYASTAGTQAELPEGVDELGALTAIDIGGGITLVPIADIKRAAMLLHTMIEGRMQRGSLSAIDLGTLAFPLSAVALIELGEGRDQVFLPRLQAKALLNQQLAEMFTNQVIQIGGSVELGTKGHKRSFNTQKLTGEYETTYRYFTKSPKIDVARYSVAAAAERYLDRQTILTEVLQLEDPQGVKERRYYDMAEMLSPMVMRRRVIKSLIEQGEEEEARLMMAEAGMTMEAIMEGQLPELPGPKAEKPTEPLIPLLGERGEMGIVRPARKAGELRRMPREEEGEKEA